MQTNTPSTVERVSIQAIIAAYGPVEHTGGPHPFSGTMDHGWTGLGGTYFAARINDGMIPKWEVRWQTGPGQQRRSRRFYGSGRRERADDYAKSLAAGTVRWVRQLVF